MKINNEISLVDGKEIEEDERNTSDRAPGGLIKLSRRQIYLGVVYFEFDEKGDRFLSIMHLIKSRQF